MKFNWLLYIRRFAWGDFYRAWLAYCIRRYVPCVAGLCRIQEAGRWHAGIAGGVLCMLDRITV